jgi:RHS repeat-associated protein
VTRGAGTTLLDLSYDYLRAGTSAGRTGRVTRVADNLDETGRKDRNYEYDRLGRLKKATGGDASAPVWEQNYTYDDYGNRKGVSSSGNVAALEAPAEPKTALPDAQVAQRVAPPEDLLRGDEARRAVSDGPTSAPLYGAAGGGGSTSFGSLLLSPPTDLKVTLSADARIRLTWVPPAGAANYRVERSASKNGPYTFVGTSATATLDDTNVSRGSAYLYRVCAAGSAGGCISSYSNTALGVAYTFDDDPIITMAEDPSGQQVTKVRALHVMQLREVVNAVRTLAGRGGAAWTNANITPQQSPIRADDVRDLRSALSEALADLGVSAPAYTDPTLATGQNGTTVRRAHVAELRLSATRGQGGPGGAASTPMPRDGLATVTYDGATNRITLAGFAYDDAGSLTRALSPSGVWVRYQYDAAGRLAKVKNDDEQTITKYTYGGSRRRLIAQHGDEGSNQRTYYIWAGDSVLAEFAESSAAPGALLWAKNNVYLTGRLLATQQSQPSGELLQFHHPDRVGTRLVTNPSSGTQFEQVTLPFGTALETDPVGGVSNVFTSYDRGGNTGLDYAVNRFYDSGQGRFTQVDPLGVGAWQLENPQSLNLYAYCANDPVNHTDPDGQFFGFLGSLFGAIGGFFLGLFGALRPNLYSFSFTFRNLPPFTFAFTPNFNQVAVGFAGIMVTVRNVQSQQLQQPGSQGQKKETEEEREIRTTVDDVRNILGSVNSCSSFFVSPTLALQALSGIKFTPGSAGPPGLGIHMSMPGGVPSGNVLYRVPNSATVNKGGPFFRGITFHEGKVVRTPWFGGYEPGSRRSRALQVLHELAHTIMVGTMPGTGRTPNPVWLIPNDGGIDGLSETNTKKIMKACKSQLDTLSN